MKKILLLLMITACAVTAQEQIKLFPGELNIQPFTANFLEPRAGFLFQTGENDIRLDIGNSRDVFHYNTGDFVFSFGADFFTYTRLSGETDFHFPVDAVDYLFGVNAGYKKKLTDKTETGLRFRLSHISAHLADGRYDHVNKQWEESGPIVYSREFIEIFPYYKYETLRAYAGFTYLFHVNPASIGSYILQTGFDYFAADFSFSNITPFLACDFKLQEIGDWNGSNTISAGFKYGHYYGGGISVIFTYYNGKNHHGEFYHKDTEYFSLGINLDL